MDYELIGVVPLPTPSHTRDQLRMRMRPPAREGRCRASFMGRILVGLLSLEGGIDLLEVKGR